MTTIVDGTTGITFPSTISGVSPTQQYSGRVLQVVANTTSTPVSTTGTADTGLTASITPTSSSSKILVLVNQEYYIYSGGTDSGLLYYLYRGATNIHYGSGHTIYIATGSSQNESINFYSINFLDSPASTSTVTYKMTSVATAGATVLNQYNSNVSTITLMEIAA